MRMRPKYQRLTGAAAVALLLFGGVVAAADAERPGTAEAPSAADRGRENITVKGYFTPAWSEGVLGRVAKLWGPGSPDPGADPKAFAEAFNKRYGLHPATVPNDGLPMGLKRGVNADGTKSGLSVDCLMCHGGSIGGRSIVGLGNTQFDPTRFFTEMTRADGRRMPPATFVINSVRGANNAGMFSAVLLSLRNPDLSFRIFPLFLGANLPELDTPAWWHLARKSTMYYDGRTPAESVRTNMQFLLGAMTLDQFKALEPDFRDVQAYLLSLKPPKYPFPIDAVAADRGSAVFAKNCASCHGTYGPGGEYPNRIVPLKEIGTDPARAYGLSDKLVAHYNKTWFAEEHPADAVMVGYQAPPLDGLWATAPYFHNGSVPTLQGVLKSSDRPSKFKRPPSTDFLYYDKARVGWTHEAVTDPEALSAEDRHYYYDTARFGLGNGGHLFGDKLPEAARADLIEYLKAL